MPSPSPRPYRFAPRFHWVRKPQTKPSAVIPLFPPEATPETPRLVLEGWARGDRCLVADLKTPGRWRKAEVVFVAIGLKLIYLRIDGEACLTDLNPILHRHMLRRPEEHARDWTQAGAAN